jgi:hypothetical protein
MIYKLMSPSSTSIFTPVFTDFLVPSNVFLDVPQNEFVPLCTNYSAAIDKSWFQQDGANNVP